MGIFRRTPARHTADDRMRGRELGLGLSVTEHDARTRRHAALPPMQCGTCGTTGRIDMIDTTVRRAYLTCPACGRIWDTDRASVPARAFFSRT